MSGHFAGTHDSSSSSASSTTVSSSSSSSSTASASASSAQQQKQEVVSKGTYSQRFIRTFKEILSFYPNDPSNPHHRRLLNQAKVRAVIVFSCFIYFGYHHPEYSFISAWYHGSDKPLAEQRWRKMSGGEGPGSKGQQEQVESIMSRSTKSVYGEKKGEEKIGGGKWF